MRLRLRHGQSILEYTVLVSVILASLLVMHIYVKRCYQGRIKQEADEVGQQYSPGHTASRIVTSITSNSTTCVGGSCTDPITGRTYNVPDGVTLTISNRTTGLTKDERVESFAREDD